VTLTVAQVPVHTHPLLASADNASSSNAGGNVLAQTPTYTPYVSGAPTNTPMAANAMTPTGAGQAHSNLQPYLCVDFIISLFGIFPSQT
jgi:microcystin-dependent protein